MLFKKTKVKTLMLFKYQGYQGKYQGENSQLPYTSLSKSFMD